MKNKIQPSIIPLLMIALALSLSSFKTAIDPAPINGFIKGVVIDSASGEKIEYATIALFRVSDSTMVSGAITNQQGEFEIGKVAQGSYYVKIQFMGFNTTITKELAINETRSTINIGTVPLIPKTNLLKVTEIIAEQRMVEYKIDKKIINANNQIASSGGTAVDLLRNTPSVTVDVEENVSLRGNMNYQVLINGRPSTIQGADALKQIPASNIDHIEVVTNPSASHDAEGTAGVINVILKKTNKPGFGGFSTVSLGTDRAIEDLNVNYQKGKWNFTMGAKIMDYNVPVYNTETRDFKGTDSANYLSDNSTQYHITSSRNISLGIDYDLNKNNLFSFSMNGGTWLHVHNFDSKYSLTNENRLVNEYTTSANDFKIGNSYFTGNINYKHLFGKDHDLTFNLFYSTIDGYRYVDGSHTYSTLEWGSGVPFFMVDADETSQSSDLRFKIDYRRLLFKDKITFETGFQSQLKPYSATMNYLVYREQNPNWTNDSTYSNDITFNTALNAGYISLSGALKKFEYKAGLRAEYYTRNFEYVNTPEKYDYKQLDFFPTLHLSYNQSKKNQFQASYSRRVNRPTAWIMYPVPDFTDNFITSAGNPDLKPEYTDSYELNYIHQFEKWSLSSELFHRNADGSFVQRLISDENGKLYQKTVNFGNEITSGIEVSANADICKWLSTNISGSFYHYLLKINYEDNQTNTASMVGNFRVNSNFLFTKTTKMQLSLSYDSPVNYVQGYFHERFNTSVSLRKDFPKQKCTITLVANNPFMDRVTKYEVKGAQFILNTKQVMNPVYYISLSFKLNNFKKQRNVGETNSVGDGVA